LVGWRCRYVGFPAQTHCKSFDGRDIFVVLSFNNGTNRRVRVSICLGCGFLDRPNFLLTRLDIARDRVLNIHDVGCGVSAPLAGIPELLPVFLKSLGRPIDSSASLFRGVSRPHMRAIEDRGLMALPLP
jgi:hypothetical protein